MWLGQFALCHQKSESLLIKHSASDLEREIQGGSTPILVPLVTVGKSNKLFAQKACCNTFVGC